MKKKRRQGSAKKAAEAARQQSQASDLDSKKESLKKASPSSSPSPKKKMSPKQTPVKSPQKASKPPSPKEKKPTAADAQDFVVVGKPSEVIEFAMLKLNLTWNKIERVFIVRIALSHMARMNVKFSKEYSTQKLKRTYRRN